VSESSSVGAPALRVAIALGGTDRGRSGISTVVRSVLAGLRKSLQGRGGALVAFGAEADRAAFASELEGVEWRETPRAFDRPGPNALWHLFRSGPLAARLGADVLLLPAANRRLTAFSPIPTVAVVHDLSQLHVSAKFDRLRMFYAKHVLVSALAGATELVAVSEATRTDLREALSCPSHRIRLIPNGVNTSRFSVPLAGDPRIAAARDSLSLHGPYLLYPARLEHPGKNHLRLLQAFAQSAAASKHKLVLAGADFGGGELIRREVARLGIGHRVRALGFVPEPLLPGLVAGADAVMMVGLHEGFGLPALEALASGRAVAASNTGALPEVTGHLAALCDPRSVASIGRALDRTLADESLRTLALAEGPQWAAARSWDKTIDGLVAACVSAAAAERERFSNCNESHSKLRRARSSS
jgi:glycosyltransferase involved in cell wall biosynthesis